MLSGAETRNVDPTHRMNRRWTLFLIIAAGLGMLFSSGVLRGQMRQNANLTIFFSGDDGGEVAPCG